MSVRVEILTSEDILRGDDLCRPLSATFDGQSDTFQTVATYGGGPINHFGWVPVDAVCPAWVGKSVGQFHTALNKLHHSTPDYEFLRGDVPLSHMEVGYGG